MGFEVELKFRVASPDDLRSRLHDRGAEEQVAIDHEDLYFAHPSRDFAESGEAFRIRGEGDGNRITYKGPKWSGPTKTREEIELGFEGGLDARGDLRLLFERLGFEVVSTVRKRRTSHEITVSGRPMTVVIDEVETLGTFAEVETLVGDQADLPEAQEAVLALAHDLGLTGLEPRSYLRMILEKSGNLSRNPPGQT